MFEVSQRWTLPARFEARHLAVSDQDELLVASDDEIVVFQADGRLLRSWAVKKNFYVFNLAIHGDKVFVKVKEIWPRNVRVLVYQKHGLFLCEWASKLPMNRENDIEFALCWQEDIMVGESYPRNFEFYSSLDGTQFRSYDVVPEKGMMIRIARVVVSPFGEVLILADCLEQTSYGWWVVLYCVLRAYSPDGILLRECKFQQKVRDINPSMAVSKNGLVFISAKDRILVLPLLAVS